MPQHMKNIMFCNTICCAASLSFRTDIDISLGAPVTQLVPRSQLVGCPCHTAGWVSHSWLGAPVTQLVGCPCHTRRIHLHQHLNSNILKSNISSCSWNVLSVSPNKKWRWRGGEVERWHEIELHTGSDTCSSADKQHI